MPTRREFLIATLAVSTSAIVLRRGAGRQASAHSAVTGRIVDRAGAPVSGARVTLIGPDGTLVAEARADAAGRYVLDAHDSGTHALGAAAPGREFRAVDVMVESGRDLGAPVLALGQDEHLGEWARIGDTSPEYLGATNSGTMMADGRIMYCHDTDDPVIFDPATGAKFIPKGSGTAQGCHAPTVLLDGRIIFIGGQAGEDPGTFRNGVKWVKVYDPLADAWERWPDLNVARWYPTVTRLPDGRLLVSGGGMPPDARRTDTAEILDPRTRTATLTGNMLNPAEFGPSALLFSGEVLRTWYPPQLWDPTTGEWRATGDFVQTDRGYPGHSPHSLVLLPDGRAVAVGMQRANYPNPSMVEIYDPLGGTWSRGASPGTLRSFPEVLLLPDGKVLAAGGAKEIAEQPGETNRWGFTALTDLYDPLADRWRSLAPMPIAREYHALTILAPDGRVIVTAGTGAPAQSGDGTDNRIDAFSPPYLFRGPRPVIERLSTADLHHGGRFTLSFSGTFAPTAVILMGLNAITHYVDGGASRHVSLPFLQDGDTLSVDVPADLVRVPAAHYILFLMVDDVPSVGRIVRVTPQAEPPPSATPIPATATSIPPSVTPTATASPPPATATVEAQRWKKHLPFTSPGR